MLFIIYFNTRVGIIIYFLLEFIFRSTFIFFNNRLIPSVKTSRLVNSLVKWKIKYYFFFFGIYYNSLLIKTIIIIVFYSNLNVNSIKIYINIMINRGISIMIYTEQCDRRSL